MNNEPKPQSFAEASSQLQDFLSQESVSSNLVWVFREDVVSRKGRILVKEPLPPENVKVAESLFQRGCQRGLGVSLDVFCLLDSRHCCYIWLPHNAREAELHLVAGLKLSMPTNLPVATSVRSWWKWRLHKWLDEKSFWAEQLPRRNI